MAKNRGEWPPTLVPLLWELWPTGLSTKKIADALSAHPDADRKFTKNSVVGQVTKQRLARRPSPLGQGYRGRLAAVAAARTKPTQSVAVVVADTKPEGDVMMVESAPSVVVETPSPAPEPKPTPAPVQLAEPPAFRRSPPPKVTPIKRLSCQYPHGHPREPGFHFCDAPVWACEDPERYNPDRSTVYCHEHEILCHQPTPMRRAA